MKIQIELQPFTVPNFVLEVMKPGLRQDGLQAVRSHPLSDLSDEALTQLCDDFRREVFRKVGRGGAKIVETEPRHSPNDGTQRQAGNEYEQY